MTTEETLKHKLSTDFPGLQVQSIKIIGDGWDNTACVINDEVVDGDTIVVKDGLGKKETVRFLGMDTPEVKDPRKAVQCFGQAASAKTHSLLDGKNVRLVADPTDSDRDKYHRLLRYVYLPDGTFVNLELVRQGYAFAYVVFPIEKLDEFRAAELEARAANRGLWAGCTVNESSKIKQTNAI